MSQDYNELENKPQLQGVTLEGNKNAGDLGLCTAADVAKKSDKYGEPINANQLVIGDDLMNVSLSFGKITVALLDKICPAGAPYTVSKITRNNGVDNIFYFGKYMRDESDHRWEMVYNGTYEGFSTDELCCIFKWNPDEHKISWGTGGGFEHVNFFWPNPQASTVSSIDIQPAHIEIFDNIIITDAPSPKVWVDCEVLYNRMTTMKDQIQKLHIEVGDLLEASMPVIRQSQITNARPNGKPNTLYKYIHDERIPYNKGTDKVYPYAMWIQPPVNPTHNIWGGAPVIVTQCGDDVVLALYSAYYCEFGGEMDHQSGYIDPTDYPIPDSFANARMLEHYTKNLEHNIWVSVAGFPAAQRTYQLFAPTEQNPSTMSKVPYGMNGSEFQSLVIWDNPQGSSDSLNARMVPIRIYKYALGGTNQCWEGSSMYNYVVSDSLSYVSYEFKNFVMSDTYIGRLIGGDVLGSHSYHCIEVPVAYYSAGYYKPQKNSDGTVEMKVLPNEKKVK
jgi:hypothetical protein